MCKRFIHGIRGGALVALLAVALVATAFAQRLPTTSDLTIEAFALAGGDISDICGEGEVDGQVSHRDCLACHIVGLAKLADAPQNIVEANYVFVAAVIATRESRAIRTVLDPAHGMRSPPLA